MNTQIKFTDRQLQFIKRAAASLPVTARDEFLKQVTARLAAEPSDSAVAAAVNLVLHSAAATFRIPANGFLNQDCVFALGLESMLLRGPPKILFQQHRSITSD
jgi:hypothetical protein